MQDRPLSKTDNFWNPQFSNFIFLFRINAPRGYGIRLTWREFQIDGCARSAIYIFDGKETDGIEPDRYCGKQKPRDWSSTGMFIIKLVETGGKAGSWPKMNFSWTVRVKDERKILMKNDSKKKDFLERKKRLKDKDKLLIR